MRRAHLSPRCQTGRALRTPAGRRGLLIRAKAQRVARTAVLSLAGGSRCSQRCRAARRPGSLVLDLALAQVCRPRYNSSFANVSTLFQSQDLFKACKCRPIYTRKDLSADRRASEHSRLFAAEFAFHSTCSLAFAKTRPSHVIRHITTLLPVSYTHLTLPTKRIV